MCLAGSVKMPFRCRDSALSACPFGLIGVVIRPYRHRRSGISPPRPAALAASNQSAKLANARRLAKIAAHKFFKVPSGRVNGTQASCLYFNEKSTGKMPVFLVSLVCKASQTNDYGTAVKTKKNANGGAFTKRID